MLNNPKWTTAPTLAGFADWLERQPADGEYVWLNRQNCAIGQYCWSIGFDPDWLSSRQYLTLEGAPEGAVHYPPHSVAADHPRTFGAAAKRARSALNPV